jgi:hypothetical protein
MEPFAHGVLRSGRLTTARQPVVFRTLMRRIGFSPEVPTAVVDAYMRLLLEENNGRAFLRIMH